MKTHFKDRLVRALAIVMLAGPGGVGCGNGSSRTIPGDRGAIGNVGGSSASDARMSDGDADVAPGRGSSTHDGAAPEAMLATDVDSASDSPQPRAFVHADGPTLVDPHGQPLLLRAVALGNWLVPEGYMWLFHGKSQKPREIEQRIAELVGPAEGAAFWRQWRGAFFTEADLARAGQLGFNSVRVAMNARLLMPEGEDGFDELEFGYLSKLVDWCGKAGMYVIVDMHAAPGGQTGHSAFDDSPTDAPELFLNEGNQDRLLKLWTEIARRFADNQWVAGYDLLNEPISPDFAQYNSRLWPLYQRIGAVIRAVDPHHALIVEGAAWADNWSTLDAPFDENLVYSFHKYWDAPTADSLQPYIIQGARWGRPIWCGETGEPKSMNWSQDTIAALEEANIGWTFWPWKKMEATNNPYSVAAPANWSVIQSWVTDRTNQPSTAAAQAIFAELIGNIQLASCRYNKPVTCEILPRTCDR